MNLSFITRKVPFYRQRKFFVPMVILACLILLRILMPTIIKVGLNSYLKDFSPSFVAHVGDVDLAILRGVYTLEDITASLKKNDKQFVSVQSASARLPWRDLFKGDPTADVLVNEMDFMYTNGLLPAIKDHMASLEKDKEKKPSPVRVAKFDLKNSTVRTDLFPALTKEEGIVLTGLEAKATNLTPTKELPRTPFSMQALLLKSGEIKTEGEALLSGEKPAWTVDSEMKDFKLTSLNQFLKQKVPLTFTKGELDLYAEAKSEGGPINGYVKPFIKGLDVIKSKEDFKGARHWFAEILTALGNVAMKADQTMATRVPFTFDKTLKTDTGESLSKTVAHGFLQELDRGIENSIGLGTEQTRQSQEEKK